MDIITIIDRAGVVGLLTFILVSGVKQVWVFGWMYREEKAEKDKWQALALRGTDLLERVSKKRPTLP